MKSKQKNIGKTLALLGLLAAVSGTAGTASASVCLLATDPETCARIDATATLNEVDAGSYSAVILESVTPSSWVNGQVAEPSGTTTFDPDWVEFNIVFDPVGTSIQASSRVRFTDRFKIKGVTGNLAVSLWLTDEDHTIIDSDWGGEKPVATVAIDFATAGAEVDENGFSDFSLQGAARFRDPVQWWDYHLAFDFRGATMAADAAIELIAPSNFAICEGDNYTDGPCAFGTDVGIVAAPYSASSDASSVPVPGPGSLILLISALFGMTVSLRKRDAA